MPTYIHYDKLKFHLSILQEELRITRQLENLLRNTIRNSSIESYAESALMEQLEVMQFESEHIQKRIIFLNHVIDSFYKLQNEISEELRYLINSTKETEHLHNT